MIFTMMNNPITDVGRDHILARLWHLANLTPEATRGSIAGQIKALSIIVAIEGLIPDRQNTPAHMQPAAPPVKAQMYASQWMRREPQAEGTEPPETVTASSFLSNLVQ